MEACLKSRPAPTKYFPRWGKIVWVLYKPRFKFLPGQLAYRRFHKFRLDFVEKYIRTYIYIYMERNREIEMENIIQNERNGQTSRAHVA